MRTLYSLFNCEESISTEDLKKVYFKLLKEVHPDKSPNLKNSELFLALIKAWEILGDKSTRFVYDNWLREQRIRENKELIGNEIHISLEEIDDFQEECRCGGIYEQLQAKIYQQVIDYFLLECSNCSLTLKVVFLGDSGVGKTTLINTLRGIHEIRPQSTLGCSIKILPHQFMAGTPAESTELIELWDIGGSNAHREASRVFLDSADGLLFVHDLSNSKSEQNLASWLELLNPQKHHSHQQNFSRLASSPTNSFYSSFDSFYHGSNIFVALDLEGPSSTAIPTLVVGTSKDQCPPKRVHEQGNISLYFSKYEHISLDARSPIQPGSTNRLVFSKFFDAVIRHSSETFNHVHGTSSPTLSLNAFSPRHRRKI